MKRFCFFVFILLICLFTFSCSSFYQKTSSTIVKISPEVISYARNIYNSDELKIIVSIKLNETDIHIEKYKSIIKEDAVNGMIFSFENLPIGKTGTVSIFVTTNKHFNDGFYVENYTNLQGNSVFTVKQKTEVIKVEVNTATEYHADFRTFTEDNGEKNNNSTIITFTEFSTIGAPLPIGTTRWQIYHNDMGNITYLGDFGKKIDVAKDLMQYKEYFINLETEENDTVYFEATGNPINQIKTPIVYSSFDSDSSSDYPYLYNFANSLNEVGENAKTLFDPSSEITDYCFDNAGNLYYIRDEYAYKLPYDFDTNSYESSIIDEYEPFYIEEYTQSIAYDQAQNTLYLLTCEPEVGDSNLVKFSNPAGTIYKESGYPESPESLSLAIEGAEQNSQSWTAHNGKIYVASVRHIEDETSSSYNLVLQEYKYVEDSSNNTWTWTSGAEKIYPINVNNTNLDFTTDIMYQDGSLYVIFRCYNTGWNKSTNYSTGGILKYDISSQTFDGEIKGLATENSKIINATSEHNISFYAPTSGETENEYFYGPTKFVAIMPKKLVFLDQGASIDDYDYDIDNSQKIPSKSRIVEYDLTSNSFSSTEITGTDLGFEFGFTM